MAFERGKDKKIKGDSLDAYISAKLNMLSNQIAIRNAADELNFSKAVLEGNMTLDEQLDYRQQQLKRSGDDISERNRLKKEVSSLKDRIEAKKFNDDYTAKLIDFESGISSIDSVGSWLQDRYNNVTDPEIKTKIKEQILSTEKAKFEIQKNVITNQTNYALNDKTDSILDEQIGRVTKEKNKALVTGNKELVTTYDLHLQSLNKAKNENQIENSIKQFSASTMVGASTAIGQLDLFNSKIDSAPTSGSVTVGGVTYTSAQEFWRTSRDKYIADDSANGLFGRLTQEKTDAIKVKQSSNMLSAKDIKDAATDFDSLTSRPELQAYNFKISTAKQSVLQTGADLVAGNVLNNYSVDYDVNKAVSALNEVKNLGANINDVMTKVITSAAQLKTTQVANILQTTQDLMENNPGMTPDQAIDTALKTGAGSMLSPEQLASKSEGQIAKEQAKGAAEGKFNPDIRATTTPENAGAAGIQNAPPVVPPKPKIYKKYSNSDKVYDAKGTWITADMAAKIPDFWSQVEMLPTPNPNPEPLPASPELNKTAPTPAPTTYKVAAGDSLSIIAQKLLGDAKRYNEIAKANNIANPNLIKPGQELIIPGK